jgi:probable phosphoglycerate mutase
MPNPITLRFVRHGETDYNAERRIQGQMMTVGLSTLGHQQAAAIAEELRGCGATALYSSDLLRAMQTARPIAAALNLEIIPEPALRERNFGVIQGRLYSEAEEIMREWWTRPDEEIEGGETNRAMFARVATFLDALIAAPPADDIILVTHGGTMNMATAHLAGLDIERMEWQRIANTAVTVVEVAAATRMATVVHSQPQSATEIL